MSTAVPYKWILKKKTCRGKYASYCIILHCPVLLVIEWESISHWRSCYRKTWYSFEFFVNFSKSKSKLALEGTPLLFWNSRWSFEVVAKIVTIFIMVSYVSRGVGRQISGSAFLSRRVSPSGTIFTTKWLSNDQLEALLPNWLAQGHKSLTAALRFLKILTSFFSWLKDDFILCDRLKIKSCNFRAFIHQGFATDIC